MARISERRDDDEQRDLQPDQPSANLIVSSKQCETEHRRDTSHKAITYREGAWLETLISSLARE